MPRFVTVLLVVVAFGSLTGLAWMMGRPTDPRVATLQADLSGAQKEISRLKEQLAVQRPVAVAVAPSATSAEAPSNPDVVAATAGQGAKGNLRDVLTTPGMRAMLEQQQAVQVDAGYGRLYELFQLDPAEKANFRQLLLAREKAQTDFALKMMDPNLPASERQKLAADMQVEKAMFDENFKTFLKSADDYNTFKQWEDTQPERVQFDMVGRNLFAQSGAPLSAEQEQQLINATAQVRKSPSAPSNLATLDGSQLTEATIQSYLEQLKKNDDQVAAQAARFLSPAQLKTLTAYQEQTRNMALTGIKMSAALGGRAK